MSKHKSQDSIIGPEEVSESNDTFEYPNHSSNDKGFNS